MPSLLIIGGTGFFGKSILDSFKRGLLNDFGITKILVLARNTDKFKSEFPELFFEGVELLNGDISNIKSLPEVDLVIHAATSTNMNDYNQNTHYIGNSIEKAVINYCDIAPLYHSNSKILYCSSGAVYGKQPLNVLNIDENFEFQQDLSELSIEKKNYCLAKRVAEKELINLGKSGLNVSIARCFAFYGKYLPRDKHYAYGNFLAAAESGNKIVVNSTHSVIRSYMHADDLVQALIRVVLESNINCPIYNVGSSKPIDLRDLAKNIGYEYGVDVVIPNKFNDNIVDCYVPNVKKLQELDFKYNTSA
jgi:nucleoside-diphosphate-sugar epimerase